MGKNKKIYRYLFIIAALFVVLPVTGYFTLRLPSVQTWLTTKFINRVSSRIDGEIEFSRIHFTYFNRVRVNDLLIKDFSADTMIYAPRFEAGIRRIKKSERLLRLGRIRIEEPVFKFRPDTTGQLNLL